MPSDPEAWAEHFLNLPFMNDTAKSWSRDRLDLWGFPSSSNTLQVNTDLMWNAIPAMLTGFFDVRTNPSHEAHHRLHNCAQQ